MFELKVVHKFDASHILPDTEHLYTKACARQHGHTYVAKVIIEADQNEKGGMVVDFGLIKNIIDELDHRHINDVFEKRDFNHEPTAENIARFIFDRIWKETKLKPFNVSIAEGYKGESLSSWAIYYGE